MIISTQTILSRLANDFANDYPLGNPIIGSSIWNLCLATLQNASMVNEIIRENDKGIPPVETFLRQNAAQIQMQRHYTDQEKKQLGMVFAFVFKEIFGYHSQKEIPISQQHNVKNATVYWDHIIVQ